MSPLPPRDGDGAKIERVHGTQLYWVWRDMKKRCSNPNHSDFHNYGGRGISVCDRWRNAGGFANFVADMGPRQPGMSIDRINNDGNYEPGNCRWATAQEQSRNKRVSRMVTAFGRTQALADWAHQSGLSYFVVANRLKRGWSPEAAVSRPSQRPRAK